MSEELEISLFCHVAECIVRHEPWDKAGGVVWGSIRLGVGFRTLRCSSQFLAREWKCRITIASAAGRGTLSTARLCFVTFDFTDATGYTSGLRADHARIVGFRVDVLAAMTGNLGLASDSSTTG